MMNRGESSDSIPIDLIPDILSRLPAKSIARFRCVSKLWGFLLHKSYFTELFLSRSSARPRLLIVIERDSEFFLFSLPQPQNPNEKSSLVVATDFDRKISFDKICCSICGYASGLLYFPSIQISEKDDDEMKVICNPSTGQYAIVPEPRENYCRGEGFLVFDPIGKQFKVLVVKGCGNGQWTILTLGTETLRWRTIQAPSNHYQGDGICINGVLYFISSYGGYYLGCFDVRSEKFKFIHLNPNNYIRFYNLINYKGKLGVADLEVDDYYGPRKLHMCVLEDIEKSEWSTYVYTLRTDEHKVVSDDDNICVVGATALGEIVLAKRYACKPFYVLYFNPERNTLVSVEIQGIGEEGQEWFGPSPVYVFVDHVEDLKFDVMKTTYAATSIRRPEQRTSSKEDHQVRTVSHQRQDHQVRTVAHQRQDYVAHQRQDRRKDHQVRTIVHQRQDYVSHQRQDYVAHQRQDRRKDHQVRTVAHQQQDRRKDHQVRTVAHRQQDRRKDHQVRTIARQDYVAHQRQDRRQDHQVRTVAHQQQDHHTFECVNKFDALCFLEDD